MQSISIITYKAPARLTDVLGLRLLYTKLKMEIACYQEHYRKECNRKAEHVDSEEPPENPWGTPAALTG